MKFILHYLFAFIDFFNPPTTFFWWEALIGFLEVASVIAVFVVSVIFLAWYFAILITIGYIAVAFAVGAIIELICKKRKH